MFKLLYTGFNVFDKKSSRISYDNYEGKDVGAYDFREERDVESAHRHQNQEGKRFSSLKKEELEIIENKGL